VDAVAVDWHRSGRSVDRLDDETRAIGQLANKWDQGLLTIKRSP
jgi:hypothetical protein